MYVLCKVLKNKIFFKTLSIFVIVRTYVGESNFKGVISMG